MTTSNFQYLDDPSTRTAAADERVARVPATVQSKEDLLAHLAKELSLPAHFGHNWDALDEVLRDLSWIREKRVVIVHLGAPTLEPYYAVLRESVADWSPGDRHELAVVFPSAQRDAVEHHLATAQKSA